MAADRPLGFVTRTSVTFSASPDIVYDVVDLRNHLDWSGETYWLQPVIRSIFKAYVNRADRKQLANLAGLAEERADT